MTVDPSLALSVAVTVAGIAINYGIVITKLNALQKHDDQSDIDNKELSNRLVHIERALIELRVALVGIDGQNGIRGDVKKLKDKIGS